MSQLLSQVESPAAIGSAASRLVRQRETDQIIEQSRASTPQAAVEQRQVQRMSIAELNQADIEDIRERFLKQRIDGRPSLVRALDIIDLPRNVVHNIIAPKAAVRKAREAGDRAAFGLPRVTGSDILEEMGVENRVVRGIAGFGIDVFTDPLTFVGAPAKGASLVGKTGSRTLTKGQTRALRKGISAAAKGEQVRNQYVREVLDSFGYSVERLNELRAKAATTRPVSPGSKLTPTQALRRSQAPEKRLQDVMTRTILGERKRGAGAGVARVTGGGLQRQGVRLVDRANWVERPGYRLSEPLRAAKSRQREAINKFFTATDQAGSVRIGGGGSAVAHVPFTDLAIEVPAFTSAARRKLGYERMARDLAKGVPAIALLDPAMGEAYTGLTRMRELLDEQHDAVREFGDVVNANYLTDRAAWDDDKAQLFDEVVEMAREDGKVGNPAMDFDDLDIQAGYNRARAEAELGLTSSQRQTEVSALMDGLTLPDGTTTGGVVNALRGTKAVTVPQMLAAKQVMDEAAALQARAVSLRAAIERGMVEGLRRTAEAKPSERLVNIGDEIAVLVGETIGGGTDVTERTVDMLHDLLKSTVRLSGHSGGTIVNHVTDLERDLIEASKIILGTSDDIIGASVLAGMATMADEAFGDDEVLASGLRVMDTMMRRTFGQRGGIANRYLANIKNKMGREAITASANEMRAVKSDIRALAEKLEVPIEFRDSLEYYVYAKMHQLMDPHGHNYYWNAEDGIEGSGALKAKIDELVKSDIIKRAAPGADDIARRYVERVKAYGNAEVDDLLLNALLPGYVSLRATPEFERAARRMGAGTSTGHRLSSQVAESFQQQRSTYQTRFHEWIVDPETGQGQFGKKIHRLFDFEMAIAQLPDAMIGALQLEAKQGNEVSAAILKKLDEVKAKMAMLDAIPDELKVAQDIRARPTDFAELNEALRLGYFDILTGGTPMPHGFFETNISHVMAARSGAHHRAIGKRMFSDMIQNVGVPLTSESWGVKRAQVGYRGTTAFGVDFEVVTLDIVRIGGVRYKVLDKGIFKENNPLKDVVESSFFLESPKEARARVAAGQAPETARIAVPEMLADKITDIAQQLNPQTGTLHTTLDFVERVTGLLKTEMLFHPAWMTFNIIGDAVLAMSGGARPDQMFKHMRTVAKLRKYVNAGQMEKVGDLVFDVGGRQYRGDEMLKMLMDSRAFENNGTIEAMMQMAFHRWIRFPSQNQPFDMSMAGLRGIPRKLHDDLKEGLHQWAVSHPDKPRLGRVMVPGGLIKDRVARRVLAPWFRVNQNVQDVMRGAAFLSHIEQGHSAAAAGDRMLRSMIDYGDFTAVESRFFRNIAPFYSWLRGNLGFQIQLLLENPKVIAGLPKLRTALEESIAGEERVPDHMRPAWMRDALMIQIGADPEKRFGMSLANSIPPAEALEILQAGMGADGIQNMLHYFVSAVNPLVSAPIAIGTGRDLFSGRSIAPTAAEGDMTITEYLKNMVRPLAEFGPDGKFWKAAERGPGQAVARLALGGRVQAMDEQRLTWGKEREFGEKEQRIRAAIRRADRNQDVGARANANLQLLLLYKQMMQEGFGESVPVWARERLGTLAA